MSDTKNNNVPAKGDLVINPKTSRPIKVGSRVWLTLVKEGLIQGHYKDSHQLAEVNDNENVDEKIQELNKDLPINQQAVRGRGKYSGKIVKRSKPPSTRDTIKHTARTTARKIKDPEVYEDLQQSDDFEAQLEKMIMEELLGLTQSQPIPIPQSRQKPRQQVRGSKKQQQHQREYYYSTTENDEGGFADPSGGNEYYEDEEDEEDEGDYYSE